THPAAADILDDGHGAVQLVQMEVAVDVHALASLDVVQDHAVLDAVDVHSVNASFSHLNAQQLQDQCHADVLAVLHLSPVGGPGILVHRHSDLVDTGQGVEDGQVRLGVLQLLRCQDVAVLQAQVVLLIEEPLLLDTGHVENVQLGDDGLQIRGLGVGDALLLQSLLLHIPGQLQLGGGDQHEVDVIVPAQ
ncbi:KilA-N domain, partial [Dysosmobacter welbionis]